MTVRPLIVYRIRLNERFQRVLPDDLAALRARYPGRLFGKHAPTHEEPVRCHVDDPNKSRSDFSGFLPGTLVFSHSADRAYRTNMISQVLWGCEPIELIVDGETRYAIDPRISNALDRSAAEFETDAHGVITRIHRYAFHPGRIDWNIFKIPETADSEIFTCTGSPDGLPEECPPLDDELILGYREDGLTGLEFEEVWRSNGSEVPTLVRSK